MDGGIRRDDSIHVYFHSLDPGMTILIPACAHMVIPSTLSGILPPRYQPLAPEENSRGFPERILPWMSILISGAPLRNLAPEIFSLVCTKKDVGDIYEKGV